MPFSLARSFSETLEWPARVNEYHDGSSQRTAMLDKPRRSWAMAKRLTPALLDELFTFWAAQGTAPFYFYNTAETLAYDPTGRSTMGRYRVRFASQWSQQVGIGRSDISVELIEVFSGSLALLDDLAILIDRSGSMAGAPLVDEKAAAISLVEGFVPLTDGGIAVYSFGDASTQLCGVSNNETAIKVAINGIAAGGDTALYECISDAAINTAAKNLVLMTDGEDHHALGFPGPVSLEQCIAACTSRGKAVYTVGFGAAIKPLILQRIAAETGGGFYSGADSGALAAITALLMDEVGG